MRSTGSHFRSLTVTDSFIALNWKFPPSAMKLASVLSAYFEDDVRARGASYYRLGAVRIKRGNATSVESGVRGSRVYDVEIGWDGRKLSLYCDCPYYEDMGGCKHIWATILAADAANFFTAITRINPRDISFDEHDDFEHDVGIAEEEPPYYAPVSRPAAPFIPLPKVAPPAWRQRIDEIVPAGSLSTAVWPARRELLYLVDIQASTARGAIILDLKTREAKLKGGWKKPAPPAITRASIPSLPNPADRRILGLLTGTAMNSDWMSYNSYESIGVGFRLRDPFASSIMPDIARTGRCLLHLNAVDHDWLPLTWDEGEPWRLILRLERFEGRQWTLAGYLRRGSEEMSLLAPPLISEGLVFTRERIAPLEEGSPVEWIAALRRLRHIDAPEGDIGQMLAALLEHPLAARIEVPEELHYEEVQPVPKPCLTFRSEKRYEWEQQHLRADLSFDYDGRRVPGALANRGIYYPAERRFVVRDLDAEAAAKAFLYEHGLEDQAAEFAGQAPGLRLSPKKLPAVAHACLTAGWHVEAEGKIFRRPGEIRVGVSSGVDWFELHGEVDYGGASAKLPALLAALRRGENMVRLDDGTYGLLPEEWLSRFGPIAGMGSARSRPSAFPAQSGRIARRAAGHPAGSGLRCDLRARAGRTAFLRRGRLRPAARRLRRAVARLSARWRRLDGFSAPLRIWRVPGRRYGGGQDGAGAGAAGGAARAAGIRRTVAGGGSQVAGLQLEAGGRPVYAATAGA